MDTSSVNLIGGPDAGKTNYIGRLWIALQTRCGAIVSAGTPNEIKYVEDVADHLNRGQFAPRTEQPSELEAEAGCVTIPLELGRSWKKFCD